jgi:hypothetical protein
MQEVTLNVCIALYVLALLLIALPVLLRVRWVVYAVSLLESLLESLWDTATGISGISDDFGESRLANQAPTRATVGWIARHIVGVV